MYKFLPRKKPRRPRRHLRTKRAAGASPMPYVPRLPRKVEVDVSKYRTCHVKRRWMSQRATPATQSASATPATQKAAAPTATPENQARRRSQPDPIRATPATQSGSRCVQVPRLPGETKVDVSKCHACHAKCCYMSPSATPATHLCLSKLCVSKLCVDKLCVCV